MPRAFKLFAYGTLQIPEVMRAVSGSGFSSEPAWLSDHARYCLAGRPYPGLCREAGATTAGILYREVDAAALWRLDAFEDDFYRRETLVVLTRGGLSVAAEVYVIPPEHHSLLVQKDWDLERFRANDLPGFLARYRLG